MYRRDGRVGCAARDGKWRRFGTQRLAFSTSARMFVSGRARLLEHRGRVVGGWNGDDEERPLVPAGSTLVIAAGRGFRYPAVMAAEVEWTGDEPHGGVRIGVIIAPPEEHDDSTDHAAVRRVVSRVIDPVFEMRWTTPGPPPHAGSSYEIVFWTGSALASGLLWDTVKKIGGALISAARELRRYPLAVRFDAEALKLIAISHVIDAFPDLSTDANLIGAIGDSVLDPTSWSLGDGAFLYRIPCIATKATYVVEVNSYGDLLALERRDYLPNDALVVSGLSI
jgi:hypothetical protein